jgi:hypothetical protein
MHTRICISALAIALVAGPLSAFDDLTRDQLSMFQDSAGWEYVSMNDADAGIRTEHTCFDGQPHPETCRGTLSFAPDNTFQQTVSIHHQSVSRHGTYQLDGDQLAFFDEFGTRDGPYTVALDTAKKTLRLETSAVRIDLLLEKEYRKNGKGR